MIASSTASRPVSDYVAVDAELRGCPISPAQLLELLTALTVGRRPQLPDEAVCLECKRRGYPCVVGLGRACACLGPVTRTGCGALCPAFGRGCYGCFGPREQANVAALASQFEADGLSATRRAGGSPASPVGGAVPDGDPGGRTGPAAAPGREASDARR